MKDNQCKINTNSQCPFEELLNKIIDNQKLVDSKVDNIMVKLWIGNGQPGLIPSQDKRISGLETIITEQQEIYKTHKANKTSIWIAIICMFITLIGDITFRIYENKTSAHITKSIE